MSSPRCALQEEPKRTEETGYAQSGSLFNLHTSYLQHLPNGLVLPERANIISAARDDVRGVVSVPLVAFFVFVR